MVLSDITHRNRHCRNNAIGGIVSLYDVFSSKFCFSQNVGNTIRRLGHALVKRIIILVAVLECSRSQGQLCEAVGDGLAFLQMVAAVIPATRHVHVGQRAVLQVARGMEPRFGISATVNAIELEHSVTEHGIDSVANNKRRRILVPHLQTETLVFREPIRQIALFQRALRATVRSGIAGITASYNLGIV